MTPLAPCHSAGKWLCGDLNLNPQLLCVTSCWPQLQREEEKPALGLPVASFLLPRVHHCGARILCGAQREAGHSTPDRGLVLPLSDLGSAREEAPGAGAGWLRASSCVTVSLLGAMLAPGPGFGLLFGRLSGVSRLETLEPGLGLHEVGSGEKTL